MAGVLWWCGHVFAHGDRDAYGFALLWGCERLIDATEQLTTEVDNIVQKATLLLVMGHDVFAFHCFYRADDLLKLMHGHYRAHFDKLQSPVAFTKRLPTLR